MKKHIYPGHFTRRKVKMGNLQVLGKERREQKDQNPSKIVKNAPRRSKTQQKHSKRWESRQRHQKRIKYKNHQVRKKWRNNQSASRRVKIAERRQNHQKPSKIGKAERGQKGKRRSAFFIGKSAFLLDLCIPPPRIGRRPSKIVPNSRKAHENL